MSRPRPQAIIPLLAALFLSANCARESDETPPTAASPVGPVPAAQQRAGNPDAGYAALVNGGYDTCGIPFRAYRQMTASDNGTEVNLGREGRNAELPYMLSSYTTQAGVEHRGPQPQR